MNVRATVQDETTKIQEYLRWPTNDDLLSECLRQQKPIEENEEEDTPSWSDKALQGMYH